MSIRSFAYRTNKLVESIAVLMLGAMTILVAIEVFFRYALLRSLYVTDELARLLFLWVTYLGASLAFAKRAHIAIELIQDRLHGPASRYLRAVASLLVLVFLVILLVTSLRLIPQQLTQRTASLGISVFWVFLALPVGALLMIFQVLISLAGVEPEEAERLRIDL